MTFTAQLNGLEDFATMKPKTSQESPEIDDKTTAQKTCLMGDKDDQGRANLCCCYIMDADGTLQDPCYHPMDSCCL